MAQQTELFSKFKHRIVDTIVEEVNKEEMRTLIKEKMVSPLLQIVFQEINRYVYGLFLLISLTLLFSLASFIILVSRTFKK